MKPPNDELDKLKYILLIPYIIYALIFAIPASLVFGYLAYMWLGLEIGVVVGGVVFVVVYYLSYYYN